MLVLSRKKNESIFVGDNIEITVLEVRGDRVRLGITAPRDVRVMRNELLTVESEVSRSKTSSAMQPADNVVSVVDETRRDDTLSSETARSRTSRPGSRRPDRPR